MIDVNLLKKSGIYSANKNDFSDIDDLEKKIEDRDGNNERRDGNTEDRDGNTEDRDGKPDG